MSWKQDQIICSWNLISTLTVHWWYIKEAFAAFCRQFLKEKENSEAIFSGRLLSLELKVFLEKSIRKYFCRISTLKSPYFDTIIWATWKKVKRFQTGKINAFFFRNLDPSNSSRLNRRKYHLVCGYNLPYLEVNAI